jgi:folate-binding protein YgfZ
VVASARARDAAGVVTPSIAAGADALARGSAFVVLGGFRRVAVTGREAVTWLQDLLTAEIASLGIDGARRAFLLTPTGRIRSEVRVIRRRDAVDLVELADDPSSIADALAPYVLSSDVVLSEPAPVAVIAAPSPGGADLLLAAVGDHAPPARPSIIGDGADLVVDPTSLDEVRSSLAAHAHEADPEAAEVLRLRRGIPRWPLDLEPGTFPVAARVDDAVADAKGCFLGQEAIAKIRNLGHPPTVLRHLEARGPARPGDPVLADGAVVGHVTGAASTGHGTVVLARIAWAHRDGDLRLADGSQVSGIAGEPD